MFNLEASIAQWREQMLVAGIKTPVPLEELEIHLREEIERQVKSGNIAQQAFANAIQQIGKADVIKNEFEKVNSAKDDWQLIQIISFGFLGVLSLWIVPCLLFKLDDLSGISPAQQMSGLAAWAAMISFAGFGQVGYKFFPVILNKRLRGAICISCSVVMVIWFAIFLFIILQRVDFTVEQFFVAIFWGFGVPWGAAFGFITGFEKAARKSVAA